MITTGPAPLPVEQTDTNARCDRCKCTAHPGEKCKPRHCGCTKHRDPNDAGAITTRGAVLLLALTTVACCVAFVAGQDLRCHRLQNTPSASTYCN